MIVVFSIIFTTNISYSAGECDSLKACLGNALTLSVTSGRSAHYVDVPASESLFSYNDNLMVEFWFKPQRQAGLVQFVAGIWGPAEDANDVWVILIDENDNLIFEVNNPNSAMKGEDNTRAILPFGEYYDTWSHAAFQFNGNSQNVEIYINGNLSATANNTQYPISYLKHPERSELSLQIGSTNALMNSPDMNRTFLGQIDEFRIWHKTFTEHEIDCQKDKSLEGSEDGLILYHRYNQNSSIFNLCDASVNSNYGIARSGAACRQSNRRFNTTMGLSSDISSLTDTLYCENSKEWKFRFSDSSDCNKTFFVRVYGDGNEYFKVSPNRFNNTVKNHEYEFTLTFTGELIGNISPNLQIYTGDRCRDNKIIPINLSSMSELSYSKDSVGFDMLKALCIETPYIDSTFTVCNSTSDKPITINSIISGMPEVFELMSPNTPFILSPGECQDIVVRFKSKDTSALYNSNLTIYSSDSCNPVTVLKLTGSVREVLGLFTTDGSSRLPNLDFGTVCVGFSSDAIQYIWSNLLDDEDIIVDTIIIPEGFTGVPFKFPITLKPQTGYLPDYFRFFPLRNGVYNDSIIFIVKSGSCTIRKSLKVSGIGYESELEFILPEIDFGSLIVGQSRTLEVEIKNNSDDPVTLSYYMKNGDGFNLSGSRTLTISPGGVGKILLSFNPSSSGIYTDEVCYFETRCYKSACIPVKGEAYEDIFVFEPEVLRLENVIGCNFKSGTITVRNKSPHDKQLSSFRLVDTSGKFTIVSPQNLPDMITLSADEKIEFEVEYSPGQTNGDRADQAYIYYKSDDIEWNIKLYGSSSSPRIFIAEETAFGQIEIGDKVSRKILIENISSFDIIIDSLNIAAGFNITYPLNFSSKVLKPRDTIYITVEFEPNIPGYYDEEILVYSSEPCEINFSGKLTGSVLILPLDIPINVMSFGFIKPCNCIERKLQLINESVAFEMRIDSIYIDDFDILNSASGFFNWHSDIMEQTGAGLPYYIPPLSRDTLRVVYCPKGAFDRDSINHEARLWVKAGGNGWGELYNVYLSGKMALLFEADNKEMIFTPTRVDTFSTPIVSEIKIPSVGFNPNRERVVIDSISFLPDERVFTASIDGSTNYPILLNPDDSLLVTVNFKPRAVRNYTAKMLIHYSEPCSDTDSTIFVSGSGFAPAFGLSFNFDNHNNEPDTLRAIVCDTLEVPVYSSRMFPADVVDINLHLGYDTNKIEFVGVESPYLFDTCKTHIPFIRQSYPDYGGSSFLLKNFCTVDSVRALMLAKFASKSGKRDTLNITLDSISFDTEEVILYNIVAANDYGTLVFLEPDLEVLSDVDFDSVQVLDCNRRYIYFKNTGDVPIQFGDLLDLPDNVRIVSTYPDSSQLIFVGDTAIIEIEFCPSKSGDIFSNAILTSNLPCSISDSLVINGIAFAPEFPVRMDISYNFDISDTLNYTIGDTIRLNIYNENDFSAIRNGIKYNIMDLSFDCTLQYNKRALKLLSTSSSLKGEMRTYYNPGNIILSFSEIDSLKRGEIAELIFLAVVPDSLMSIFYIYADNFKTDSLLFLDFKSDTLYGFCNSGGKCELTYLKYSDNIHELQQNYPNPWSDYTEIRFSIMEKVEVFLDIYSADGVRVMSLLDGTQIMEPGEYIVRIESLDLQSGIYFYNIRAGIFSKSKSMILIK